LVSRIRDNNDEESVLKLSSLLMACDEKHMEKYSFEEVTALKRFDIFLA
jgi:hypothetical protein